MKNKMTDLESLLISYDSTTVWETWLKKVMRMEV